jgi:DNA/RNA-binding domain of Phe-tRNA-synthetase-like protein
VSGGAPITFGPLDPATGARLAWCTLTVARDPTRRSPPVLRERLRALSDRHVSDPRRHEIPAAYDRLQRRLGIDRRSPPEALTVARLIRGAYRSRGILADALTLATADTEVAVWALDADALRGDPRIDGRAVADDTGLLADLFSTPATVTHATRALLLFTVVAPGIPDLAVEEALHTARELTAAHA